MCSTWSARLQEYQIGYIHFLETMKHRGDPQVCHFLKAVPLQRMLRKKHHSCD